MKLIKPLHFQVIILVVSFCIVACDRAENLKENIPLPEHPRPDFERSNWINLNGYWEFEFDGANMGEKESWYYGQKPFTKKILVPFPWGAPLSEVENTEDIAWYKRKISIPGAWKGMRVFVIIGASDWLTKGWIDGNEVGRYQGGYTPFEFELTEHIKFGSEHELVLRVDDLPHDFKLFGKQGYGNAKGIWQTVYLEARPDHFIKNFYFTPDIDREKLHVSVLFEKALEADAEVLLNFVEESGKYTIGKALANAGQSDLFFEVDVPEPRLWSLEDPYLYDVELILQGNSPDVISTYFGMRKIGVEKLPGTDIPYVALNNKPIYLQTALDQAYHPEGYYTFPSDEFIKNEIWRSKEIGLNGQRVHIKVPIPRKLYWADRLGHLIMADVPNSWGRPDSDMQRETRVAMEGMIARDYNHPSIFSWVLFNETWGLFSKDENGNSVYKKETQEWVAQMYHDAKMLDSTRLVEDNSPCNYDHVITDINTWHSYLPGYAWKDFLGNVTKQTYIGSPWNFTDGHFQSDVPMFNSECGNVWGYEGSTGDVDWSWDYHIMINEFRRHPKVAGWLYTEHHDVINEWNGYWKYDRTMKYTGMEELVDGMKLNDMHTYIYLAPGIDLCKEAKPGARIEVPVRLSIMTEKIPEGEVDLKLNLYGWNTLGEKKDISSTVQKISLRPWEQRDLDPLKVTMPDQSGIYIFSMQLVNTDGQLLHSNFTTFRVTGGPIPENTLMFSPASYSDANWSQKQWNVLDGLKVNGAGHGYFEYVVALPGGMDLTDYKQGTLIAELSSKPLNGKDKVQKDNAGNDYMRGKGMQDPSQNPNAYPMTDEYPNPSKVAISVNGKMVSEIDLEDDPADHRGILSWHAQPKDRKLREAGTYGYLVKTPMNKTMIDRLKADGKITIRFEVDATNAGGLAIYGKDFGRYPLDPTIVFE
ncbi:MAG: glycoside hydrolase family 2 [Cytophagales bacterium]|nr:glycoside hydrolase family 2 [Cytophagales bacterium]